MFDSLPSFRKPFVLTFPFPARNSRGTFQRLKVTCDKRRKWGWTRTRRNRPGLWRPTDAGKTSRGTFSMQSLMQPKHTLFSYWGFCFVVHMVWCEYLALSTGLPGVGLKNGGVSIEKSGASTGGVQLIFTYTTMFVSAPFFFAYWYSGSDDLATRLDHRL